MLRTRKAWLPGLPNALQNLKFMFITMLSLLKNTTFSTAVHWAYDIKDVRTKFATSDTRLLDTLCDVNIERRIDVRQKYSKLTWSKKLRLTRSIVIKLPVRRNKQNAYPQLGTVRVYDQKFLLSSCSYLCVTSENIVSTTKSALIGCQ